MSFVWLDNRHSGQAERDPESRHKLDSRFRGNDWELSRWIELLIEYVTVFMKSCT